MHSSECTDPVMIKGKRGVVLGGSKSATVNAVNNGAQSVHWVYHEPLWRVPYFVGDINFKRLLYMRAQEQQFNAGGKKRASTHCRQDIQTAGLGQLSRA